MSLVLNETASFLQDQTQKFAREKTPTAHFRSIRDSENPDCFDREIWKQMADQGLTGILIPEEFGGSNFGLSGIGIVLQELGRTLTPSPLLATAVIGTSFLSKLGTEEQKKRYLPEIVKGNITCCFAFEEGPRHNPIVSETNAEKKGNKFIINGKKTFVIDGGFADLVIIAAKTKNGVSLFTADRDSDGIEINQTKMVDSRNAANMTFENLEINSDAILGELDSAQDTINEVLDISRAVLAAEMLGGALEAFEITLSYLKEREQFGAKIGSFQALQHRAANMFTELELCKSCVLESLSAFDENSNDIQRLVSLSKAKVGETFHLVSNEGVQMHGGVGVTDEYDIGLYLKRARVAEQTFGNSEFHRNRYAEITGY